MLLRVVSFFRRKYADTFAMSFGPGWHMKKRKRKCTLHTPRDVSQYGERVETACKGQESNPYQLVFVTDTSATTCHGCKGKVREKQLAAPPPPPYDLFIRHSERRVYNWPGETKIRFSARLEMVYYHPLKECTNLSVQDVKDGKFHARDDILKHLNLVDERLLFQEFGRTF